MLSGCLLDDQPETAAVQMSPVVDKTGFLCVCRGKGRYQRIVCHEVFGYRKKSHILTVLAGGMNRLQREFSEYP